MSLFPLTSALSPEAGERQEEAALRHLSSYTFKLNVPLCPLVSVWYISSTNAAGTV